MNDLFGKEKETKVYFCIRTSTEVYNYGTEEEELGDTTVTLLGVYDYEHAMERIIKDYEFDANLILSKVIYQRSQEYKIIQEYSCTNAVMIEEFFDSTWINRTIMQPVFEEACQSVE